MLSVRAERRTTRGRWLRSCAVGVLVAVGAAACGEEADQAPDLPLAGEVERFDVGSDPAVVFKPEGDVEGILIYHHGAGETIDELVELQSRSTSLVGRLLEEGWAVAATAAGGDHWGSQAGIRSEEHTSELQSLMRT